MYGNAGANMLDGKGGADVMTGFGGADSFAFTSALGGGNVDRIGDFSSLDDTILLDDAVFAGLGPRRAQAERLRDRKPGRRRRRSDHLQQRDRGAAVRRRRQRRRSAAVQFATVDGAPFIAASDFMVI